MKFLDLTAQYKLIKKEIQFSLKEIIDRGDFIGGEKVDEFEKRFAAFCGVNHAVSVNSGTDALFLSLKTLEIGEGDEVITTPFTFIATAGAIVNSGAKPVFVDITPDTFNIGVSLVEKAITKKTKAIMPVHLFGQMSNMEKLKRICKKNSLKIIEDAAQAVGSEVIDKKRIKAGSIGDLGCFSFFPSKNLGAFGDGGMITTNDKKLADKIRLLKNHGSSPQEKYKNLIIGTNSRLDSLQASVLMVKLKHLKRWTKERVEKADYYSEKLRRIEGIKVPVIGETTTHIFHQYTIRAKKRDKLQEYLKKEGVPTMIYYPIPLHLQPALKFLGHNNGDFPESEKAAKEVLSLPIYPELTKKDQDLVIGKVKEFYERQN
jgi:dTDP-4-amino-4,6-dideoxygalactose transaminase